MLYVKQIKVDMFSSLFQILRKTTEGCDLYIGPDGSYLPQWCSVSSNPIDDITNNNGLKNRVSTLM